MLDLIDLGFGTQVRITQRENLLLRPLLFDSVLLRVSCISFEYLEEGLADVIDANLFKEAFESAQEKNAGSGGGAAADAEAGADGSDSEAEEEEKKTETVPVAVSWPIPVIVTWE